MRRTVLLGFLLHGGQGRIIKHYMLFNGRHAVVVTIRARYWDSYEFCSYSKSGGDGLRAMPRQAVAKTILLHLYWLLPWLRSLKPLPTSLTPSLLALEMATYFLSESAFSLASVSESSTCTIRCYWTVGSGNYTV